MITSMIVAVDTGGTFTDFVLVATDGSLEVFKRSSTPKDPSESILSGIETALARLPVSGTLELSHGTTVATNALLEGKGAQCALITTHGFRDVLEIGRQARLKLYTFNPFRSSPLLDKRHRHEITERLDWTGRCVVPLDIAEVQKMLDTFKMDGIESIACCLLFSYLNPSHELIVGKAAGEQGFSVSLSSDIAPEPREFERTATTVANALVSPIMERYLIRLELALATMFDRSECSMQMRVMQSNGGALSIRGAAQYAIKTVLSGPAGGIVAAAHVAHVTGYSNLLTLDMGGTSTDVALLRSGSCPVVTDGSINEIPIRTPMLDIHTIGAGGGSIARLDLAGALRVGPESAGAVPGPVAYGRGDKLTVTDANVALGRLPHSVLLGGSVSLNADRVADEFSRLAAAMGCSVDSAASGIIEVVNAAMVRALRHISTERGLDPRQYRLLSFGGAGGLHACALADALSMPGVIVPRYPGAFSAIGLALADYQYEQLRALPAQSLVDSEATLTKLRASFMEMEDAVSMEIQADGIAAREWRTVRTLDLRYCGQAFDLRVDVPQSLNSEEIAALFHQIHRERYGHADSRNRVEVVAARVTVSARSPFAIARPRLAEDHATPAALVTVYCRDGWRQAPLFKRDELALDQIIIGPAIIVQSDSTLFLDVGWFGVTDVFGNLLLSHS